MYCDKCNNRLMGIEKYCPECGNPVNNNIKENTDIKNNKNINNVENYRSASIALGIISLVGVFLGIFAPISLVLSIIGLIFAIKSNKNVKNTIGIVLNSISLFISMIITLFIALVIYLAVDIYQNDGMNINDYINDNIITNNDNYGEDF